MEQNKFKNKYLSTFRLADITATRWLIATCGGIVLYVLLDSVSLPYYTLSGLIRIQIDPAIVIVPVVAAFCGPLSGLLVGFFGSLLSDVIYTHQIVTFGLVNLAIGSIGLVAGIPNYLKQGGFGHWKVLVKFIIFTFAGLLLCSGIFLLSLVWISNQSLIMTLLYNFLPFFTVSLISLLIIAPVITSIIEVSFVSKKTLA